MITKFLIKQGGAEQVAGNIVDFVKSEVDKYGGTGKITDKIIGLTDKLKKQE
jgi:hypothetical protein